jgi:hypothetical protein
VGDKLGLQVDHKSGEVVTAGIASTLLAQLLRVAASGEVYALCCRLLSYIDERAAAANDYSKLFASEERFPNVFRWGDCTPDADLVCDGMKSSKHGR